MLKLAINATSLAPGGGMTGLVGYLKAWREIEAPLEITLYAAHADVLASARRARPDIVVEPLALEMPVQKRFAAQMISRKFGRVIEQGRPDCVMTTQFLVGRCGVPQLVHHRNLWRFLTPSLWQSGRRGVGRLLRDWAGRGALKGAATNAFISDYIRLEAEKYAPNSAAKNETVYNGVSGSLIEAAQRAEVRWSGRPHLVAITSDAVHKDNPTLIRMLGALVRRRGDVDWRLSVAGGKDFRKEQELAASLGVADRIAWLGYVDHERLDGLLGDALCLVFTSKLEGFGLPTVEAMARLCPPVASNCTAIPEVVGDAGLLVEPGDAEGFASAVTNLYEDEGLRGALVEKGRARVGAFRWENSARKMLALFERIAR